MRKGIKLIGIVVPARTDHHKYLKILLWIGLDQNMQHYSGVVRLPSAVDNSNTNTQKGTTRVSKYKF